MLFHQVWTNNGPCCMPVASGYPVSSGQPYGLPINAIGQCTPVNACNPFAAINGFGQCVPMSPYGQQVPVNTFGQQVPVNTYGQQIPVNTFGQQVPVNTFGPYGPVNGIGQYGPGNTFGQYGNAYTPWIGGRFGAGTPATTPFATGGMPIGNTGIFGTTPCIPGVGCTPNGIGQNVPVNGFAPYSSFPVTPLGTIPGTPVINQVPSPAFGINGTTPPISTILPIPQTTGWSNPGWLGWNNGLTNQLPATTFGPWSGVPTGGTTPGYGYGFGGVGCFPNLNNVTPYGQINGPVNGIPYGLLQNGLVTGGIGNVPWTLGQPNVTPFTGLGGLNPWNQLNQWGQWTTPTAWSAYGNQTVSGPLDMTCVKPFGNRNPFVNYGFDVSIDNAAGTGFGPSIQTGNCVAAVA